ncbi:molybdopterin-dependent oxidoreductase (plasmid) [Deinococcus radiomollis]|uniref:molybdopterin cofactor-binding domain-containing protein n=1 Tax=Deinococcus radiomollis TaxID=468916 RepID=UPI003892CBBD
MARTALLGKLRRYTVLGQVAAEMLGLSLEQVQARLGDSESPESSGSGVSWGANSSSAGVYVARDELRPALAKKAGYTSANPVSRGGKVRQGAEYAGLSGLFGSEGLSATGRVTYGDLDGQFAQARFSAHFVEVRVNAYTAENGVKGQGRSRAAFPSTRTPPERSVSRR